MFGVQAAEVAQCRRVLHVVELVEAARRNRVVARTHRRRLRHGPHRPHDGGTEQDGQQQTDFPAKPTHNHQ